ncbi:cytochrome P450 [Deinococcus radiopugnans]|uniref:Cytochrome P450 n=1 Tax=Deinococcus radiopugnans ATCC 19172 TaxID=585398 RepID=A0A5C4Y077_9DEIO|nr:cytochrome P450 [Deinococcus radiopugnans]MBB6017988.1 unspecific monooxygenase [Deinococcus radiopugnans ATCC 19172]TNM68857.1 cytochrome P450 [Deinococcus radiopugnans ATCC 19172]
MSPPNLPVFRLPVTDPAFVQNPYPLLAELRETTPVFFDPGMNRVVLTRYADISAVLRDKRFGRSALHRYSRDELGWPPPDPAQQHFDAFNGNHLLDSEPPKHTRLRSLVGLAFTPRRVEGLQKRIEAILAGQLRGLGEAGAFDLVADYAEPLPVTVIAELLGVPPTDRALLRPWSAAIVRLYEPSADSLAQAEAERAVLDFSALLRELSGQRRRQPQDDLITALVGAEQDGDRLSEQELIDTCILLLNAGHEASVNGLAAGVLALLRQREHWDALVAAAPREDSLPLFRRAAEELLRFDTPLPMFERIALESMELHGAALKPGDRVSLLYASGNRDPRKFDVPGALNLNRDPNPHLTFGLGIHYCLGAPLARLELALSLRALCRALPDLRLKHADEPGQYTGGFVIRGLARLDVVNG